MFPLAARGKDRGPTKSVPRFAKLIVDIAHFRILDETSELRTVKFSAPAIAHEGFHAYQEPNLRRSISQTMEETELCGRDLHAFKAKKNSERRTRNLRCVRPSVPNPNLVGRTTKLMDKTQSSTALHFLQNSSSIGRRAMFDMSSSFGRRLQLFGSAYVEARQAGLKCVGRPKNSKEPQRMVGDKRMDGKSDAPADRCRVCASGRTTWRGGEGGRRCSSDQCRLGQRTTAGQHISHHFRHVSSKPMGAIEVQQVEVAAELDAVAAYSRAAPWQAKAAVETLLPHCL